MWGLWVFPKQLFYEILSHFIFMYFLFHILLYILKILCYLQQHMMPPYGTPPPPCVAMYFHRAMYTHPSLPAVCSISVLDIYGVLNC